MDNTPPSVLEARPTATTGPSTVVDVIANDLLDPVASSILVDGQPQPTEYVRLWSLETGWRCYFEASPTGLGTGEHTATVRLVEDGLFTARRPVPLALPGTHEVRFRVRDLVGNESWATWSFTVQPLSLLSS